VVKILNIGSFSYVASVLPASISLHRIRDYDDLIESLIEAESSSHDDKGVRESDPIWMDKMMDTCSCLISGTCEPTGTVLAPSSS
jgi:hypothetical protein